ncbi:YqaJ-like viral recombinase domain protein [Glutamicibacter creatinolyticus]|uniref:YqaJ-like viral recombinase domain protein n=1 Tax=Glutamicibacter creatinolyticus TaxID=162496 RepID=A0A5B7WXJ8_9MICC|nr:YqaJ viral recombinase family protein [Glutamicibacter creatinolyticus]QCY48065.1 YqaJ-like viral recombinase domain protein [Glutamicibacter creatinolyticus]
MGRVSVASSLGSPVGSPAGHECFQRVLADSSNRIEWLRARSQGITATDVAKLSTERSIKSAAWDKLYGSGFSGNPYTEHGRRREPVIANWVLENFNIFPSSQLFHSRENRLHLATPDGLGFDAQGTPVLAEIKTTNKPFNRVPRHYLRQILWQQYVIGAERTLFVWEQHENFIPLNAVPEFRWVERDDTMIADLIAKAGSLIDELRRRTLRQQQLDDYGPAALRL